VGESISSVGGVGRVVAVTVVMPFCFVRGFIQVDGSSVEAVLLDLVRVLMVG
jgi:hypothetical protein